MKWPVSIGTVAAAVFVLLGCGSSSSTPSSTSPEAIRRSGLASQDSSQGCGGSIRSFVPEVVRFEEALGRPDPMALRHIFGGQFKWFSVTGWPAGQLTNFAAYAPDRAIAFVERESGLGFHLQSVAISPAEGPYVNVAYQGVVEQSELPDRGSAGIIVGKAAFNCNGTVRVWSMAVRRRGTPAEFTVCPDRAQAEGLSVCRQI